MNDSNYVQFLIGIDKIKDIPPYNIFQSKKNSILGYFLSAAAFYLGVLLGWNFEESLILFAISMSLYYITLLFWYIRITKKHSLLSS